MEAISNNVNYLAVTHDGVGGNACVERKVEPAAASYPCAWHQYTSPVPAPRYSGIENATLFTAPRKHRQNSVEAATAHIKADVHFQSSYANWMCMLKK